MRVSRLLAAAALGGVACGPASGYEPPRPLTRYVYVLLGTDAMADGLAESLIADGLRVRRGMEGGGRPAAAVLVFPFEGRVDVRVVDTRSGRAVTSVSVERSMLPTEAGAAGEALGRILAQAIRRPAAS